MLRKNQLGGMVIGRMKIQCLAYADDIALLGIYELARKELEENQCRKIKDPEV